MRIWSEFSSKWTPAAIVLYQSCSQQCQLSLCDGTHSTQEKACQCSSIVFIFLLSLLYDPLPKYLGGRANIKFIFGYLVFYVSRSLLSYSPVYSNGLLLIFSLLPLPHFSFLPLPLPFSSLTYSFSCFCSFGKEEICYCKNICL